jgi:hypothetical protein
VIWLLIALGYIAGGFATSLWIARDEYKELVSSRTAGLKQRSDEWYRAEGERTWLDPWTDEEETKRREKCKSMAVSTGLKWGAFWPAAVVMFLVANTVDVLRKLVGGIAVSPLERERAKEIEYKKAQKIVEEYEKEEKRKWESNFKA